MTTDKKIEYSMLIKQITSCSNLLELQDIVPVVNSFLRKYKLNSSTEEFKKLETVISLMRIKLKHNFNIEKKVRESKLLSIFKKIIKEEIKNK
jgi:hypothetical protein